MTGPTWSAAIHAGPTIHVIICRCFPQDTSLMTQITTQGHENEDRFFPEMPPFFGRCPIAETEDRLMECGADGRDTFSVRKEVPEHSPEAWLV